MTIFQRWKQTALHNKALVLTGAIVALGTLVSTVAVVVQICIMRENNKNTSQQVVQLIKAAEIQAGAAQKNAAASARNADAADKSSQAAADFATQAKGINAQTRAAVTEFHSIAKSSERSIQATQEAADKALNVSIAEARLDQRPWLGPRAEEIVSFKPNEMFKVELVFINSGKTPALYAKIGKNQALAPADFDGPLTDDDSLKWSDAGAIPPQSPFVVEFDDTPDYHVGRAYDAILNGTQFWSIWGKLVYFDSAGGGLAGHSTHFCFKLDRISKTLTLCEKGNDMN